MKMQIFGNDVIFSSSRVSYPIIVNNQ